jgi:hypothetical protein
MIWLTWSQVRMSALRFGGPRGITGRRVRCHPHDKGRRINSIIINSNSIRALVTGLLPALHFRPGDLHSWSPSPCQAHRLG